MIPAPRPVVLRQAGRWRISKMADSYYPVPMYRTVSVKLKDRVLADIEAEARARRTTRSGVVRERLERPGAASGSLWDRMHDLVIADDAAPKDLARNKSRLRGLGRPRRR